MLPNNTTPVPNRLFSDYLPILSAVELKALLLIIRGTLGWKDLRTGKRKERDWISNSQFVKKAGMSERSVSTAIQSLVEKKIIKATDANGDDLSDPMNRKFASRVYYGLNATLNPTANFATKTKERVTTNVNTARQNIQTTANIAEDRPQNLRSTKEIFSQKSSQQGFQLAKKSYEKIKQQQEEEQNKRDNWE